MASNRATVEELIRRMNARDLHPTELCHPDVEWRWPASTPGAAVFRGHDGVTEGLAAWLESWQELDMETEEILEDGDWVLAILRYHARGAGSGVLLEESVAHLHQLENGLLRRWWMFGDAEKAKRRFLAGDRPGGRRSATIGRMADPDDPSRDPDVPPAPKLPDVESPPPEDVLDEVPPKEELVERARSADEIVEEQPSVDELLDRDR